MTRELKFRYTVKRENGHVFSQIFTLDEIERGDVLQWKKVNHIGENTEVFREQFSGLTDKNKKEIYENDIAKSINWRFGIYQIIFYKPTARFCATNGNQIENISQLVSGECFEIIGNTHENPELLLGE